MMKLIIKMILLSWYIREFISDVLTGLRFWMRNVGTDKDGGTVLDKDGGTDKDRHRDKDKAIIRI